MNYQIYYFQDEKGTEPVREYIGRLTEAERAKVFAYLDYLSEVGPQMRRPMTDYLGDKTGL